MKLSFGELVKTRRQELKMTKVELSEKSGVSTVNIRLIENGAITTPQPITVKKLSDALDLNYEELYDSL